MNDFSFSTIPELVFGTGTFRLLPRMLERYGRHFLLVTGQRSFRESIPAQHFFSDMKNRGFQWSEISVHGEPSAEQIDFAVQQIRPNLPDAVVAIGGGSVIDAGKALAAMLVSPLPVEHYLEGVGNQAPPGNKLPFVAVPTTAGTGSEATKNAVLSRVGEKGYKSSLRHDRYIPDQALIDPELQLSCPFRLTACSGMDAFSQLLESYLSTKASPLTDALALEGLRNVSESLARFSNDSLNDRIFRSKMAYAAWLSGITLANAGLGTVHGFAGSIGARFAIPHGTVCGA
ncbi:MAG TPA: iron-containing alcohol dehydrogenase, partial [Prolixibacteraceae bacterium]|nr:iron-containing alcohol dehydrogenase [Prolixibacteraceae bacterium]